jgi:hypothetical protein
VTQQVHLQQWAPAAATVLLPAWQLSDRAQAELMMRLAQMAQPLR